MAINSPTDKTDISFPAKVFGESGIDLRGRKQFVVGKKAEELNTESEQSSIHKIKDTAESVDLEESSPGYCSPESVLFEWQSAELPCCKELSPKIVPRMTKLRLNLDLPEPVSDENESDHTNSISEKKGQIFDCPDNELEIAKNSKLNNGSFDNDALDKTISVNTVFDTTPEKIRDIPRVTFNSVESLVPVVPDENAAALPEPLLNSSIELAQEACSSRTSKSHDYYGVVGTVKKEPVKVHRNSLSNADTNAGISHLQIEHFHRPGRNSLSGTKEEIPKPHSQTKVEQTNVRNLHSQGIASVESFSSKPRLIGTHWPAQKFKGLEEPRPLPQPVKLHKPCAPSKIHQPDGHLNKSAKNNCNEIIGNLMSTESITVLDSGCKEIKVSTVKS